MTLPLTAYEAHPVDLITAIYGNNTVSLKGFGAQSMPHSWIRPGLRFVGHDEVSPNSIYNEHPRLRNLYLFRSSIFILSIICSIFASIWFGNTFLWKAQPIIVSQSWSVNEISAGSIIVDIANKKSTINIGEKTPNGEVLVSTMPAKHAYITNKSTVIINVDTTPLIGSDK